MGVPGMLTPPLLLLLLLLVQACIPAAWGLRCMRCERTGHCQVQECPPGQDLCRTTILSIWQEGEELEVVETDCAHPEKTNRTMSYRIGMQIITLTEAVCGFDLCNRPNPGEYDNPCHAQPQTLSNLTPYFYLLVGTESDAHFQGSDARDDASVLCGPCTEGWSRENRQAAAGWAKPGSGPSSTICPLPCPTGSPGDERHSRGCGNLPGCPGPTGFHNNHTFHFLRCCNTTKCNGGPVTELEKLPLNGLQCYSCQGNGTHGCSSEEASLTACRGPMNQCLEATGTNGLGHLSYTIRGCATASWCQGLHVAEGFKLTDPNVSCCTGNGCNHPNRDAQSRRGVPPVPTQPTSASPSLCL
ncbi:PREDICTED: LOW QUALITY PROTEIN: urokinase plasminogen activator surface receptor [Myotis davidii]|uniref:LOW QUALITY PROTEIN: urokinase plasminogen activator surface receptor n=1 Tax=Myotis davidii TaxID=225400 RepID=UPI0007672B6C|nr:PREDICTED: LOW QUALITY PROTEIN: urokinase plasminogen activator surface receptor [Myotis davidii]